MRQSLFSFVFLFVSTTVFGQSGAFLSNQGSRTNSALVGMNGENYFNLQSSYSGSEPYYKSFYNSLLFETKLKKSNSGIGGQVGFNYTDLDFAPRYYFTNVELRYAKYFNLKKGGLISAGLSASYFNLQSSSIFFPTLNIFNASLAGAYKKNNFTGGLELTNLLGGLNTNKFDTDPHLNLYASYKFRLSKNLTFTPSAIWGAVDQLDLLYNGTINLRFDVKNNLRLGMYAGNQSFGLFAGYNFTERFSADVYFSGQNFTTGGFNKSRNVGIQLVFKMGKKSVPGEDRLE